MKQGLLITWIGVSLLGLFLVASAIWFQYRAGSYLAIPEIAGGVGLYIAFHGITVVRRLLKGTPKK